MIFSYLQVNNLIIALEFRICSIERIIFAAWQCLKLVYYYGMLKNCQIQNTCMILNGEGVHTS
jgi:hypothetical protein